MQETFSGIPASEGGAYGPAFVIDMPDLSIDYRLIQEVDREIQRLNEARRLVGQDLEKLKQRAVTKMGDQAALVFDAHLLILRDPEIQTQIENMIIHQKLSAEWAVEKVSRQIQRTLKSLHENPYMQERTADIRDIARRMTAKLLGIELVDLSLIDQPVILMTHDLSPSDTAQLNQEFIKGIVTEVGGLTSHSAIMARSMGIPAVLGIHGILKCIQLGQMVAVDGSKGVVTLNPSGAYQQTIDQMTQAQAVDQEALKEYTRGQSLSKDGHRMVIGANISQLSELQRAISVGAEGIGLYRSEFLFINGQKLPDEETQFQAYKKVLEAMPHQEVVVRTLDIGGDKGLAYLDLDEEMNPFLGYRAIRVSLGQKEIFRTQLRALLRASVHGRLSIMFPMISQVEEILEVKDFYEKVKSELFQEGMAISPEVKLGIMIEVPAAAMMADQLAQEVDFFSIGTNDLIQYTMAADRLNERVSYLYQPYHPAIIRLINQVVRAGHQAGIEVRMCGEMAGDLKVLPLLLAMGLDELSMTANLIPKVRRRLLHLDRTAFQPLLEDIVHKYRTSQEVEQILSLIVENI